MQMNHWISIAKSDNRLSGSRRLLFEDRVVFKVSILFSGVQAAATPFYFADKIYTCRAISR